jgi:hypothetical protein
MLRVLRPELVTIEYAGAEAIFNDTRSNYRQRDPTAPPSLVLPFRDKLKRCNLIHYIKVVIPLLLLRYCYSVIVIGLLLLR